MIHNDTTFYIYHHQPSPPLVTFLAENGSGGLFQILFMNKYLFKKVFTIFIENGVWLIYCILKFIFFLDWCLDVLIICRTWRNSIVYLSNFIVLSLNIKILLKSRHTENGNKEPSYFYLHTDDCHLIFIINLKKNKKCRKYFCMHKIKDYENIYDK